MHVFDRDGSKHRSAEQVSPLFVVGCICVVVLILAGLSALPDLMNYLAH
jgi:hypothetical protein